MLLPLLLLLSLARASAQPVPKMRIVIVTLDDGEPVDAALSGALRELLGRVGLRLVERDDEAAEDVPLARVRIARVEDGVELRVFHRGSTAPVSVHRVPGAESEALFRETLAHVVLGAIEPLLVSSGADEPAVQRSEPPPAPAQAAAVSTHFGASLGAGTVVLGDWWGARLFGRADAYVGTRVASVFGLTLGGVLPRERERFDSQAELSLTFARLQAGIEPLVHRLLRLGILLTLGADLVSASVEPRRAVERVRSPKRLVDAMLGGFVQLRFPFAHGLELQTLLGADVDLTPRKFVAADGARTRTLFELARVRPYAGLALGWSSL